MSTKGPCRRAACSVFGRLDLVRFEGFHSFKDVAVDIGAVGVFEGGADQGCPPGFDSLVAVDEVVEFSDGLADAVLELQGAV